MFLIDEPDPHVAFARVDHPLGEGDPFVGKTLQQAGALPSMGRRGDAYDNALAESFFATLETELLERHTFITRDHARIAVFEYIEGFYNTRRRHSALGNTSPNRFEETMTNIKPKTATAV